MLASAEVPALETRQEIREQRVGWSETALTHCRSCPYNVNLAFPRLFVGLFRFSIRHHLSRPHDIWRHTRSPAPPSSRPHPIYFPSPIPLIITYSFPSAISTYTPPSMGRTNSKRAQ